MPGNIVNHDAAGEGFDTPLRQQAASPYHVHKGEIDQRLVSR